MGNDNNLYNNNCKDSERTSGMIKTAVVSIIGRPSAGKSTFVNTASGEFVSIVSPIPQTTRNAIKGIVNTPSGQLVFIDTPGYHVSDKKLNIRLKTLTEGQLSDADCILYILDSTRVPKKEEQITAALARPYAAKTVVAVNKIDLPNVKIDICRTFIAEELPKIPSNRIMAMSAKTKDGVDEVLKALFSLAPESPRLYPEEYYTDQEVGFRISEVIRGQAINRLSEEIPHALYVNIADMEMRNNGKRLWVRAFVCVERESQKGILIGKNAAMIKAIRLESIKQLKKIFPYNVDLDLQVKVEKNWRQKDSILSKIIHT